MKHQHKPSIKEKDTLAQHRDSADWVKQAVPLRTDEKNDVPLGSGRADEPVYDSTSEEIIATHNTNTQEEGVDEEWSGDGAENKDFSGNNDDELA